MDHAFGPGVVINAVDVAADADVIDPQPFDEVVDGIGQFRERGGPIGGSGRVRREPLFAVEVFLSRTVIAQANAFLRVLGTTQDVAMSRRDNGRSSWKCG